MGIIVAKHGGRNEGVVRVINERVPLLVHVELLPQGDQLRRLLYRFSLGVAYLDCLYVCFVRDIWEPVKLLEPRHCDSCRGIRLLEGCYSISRLVLLSEEVQVLCSAAA